MHSLYIYLNIILKQKQNKEGRNNMKIIKLNDESIIPKLFKHYEEIVDKYNNKKIDI